VSLDLLDKLAVDEKRSSGRGSSFGLLVDDAYMIPPSRLKSERLEPDARPRRGHGGLQDQVARISLQVYEDKACLRWVKGSEYGGVQIRIKVHNLKPN
jgi:hypothetical protein